LILSIIIVLKNLKYRTGIRIVGISLLYAFLLFMYASFTLTGSVIGASFRWGSFFFIIFASILGGVALYNTFSLVKKKIYPSRLSGPPFLFRLSLGILMIPLIFGLFTLLYRSIFLPGISWDEVIETWPDILPKGILISIFTGIVYALIDHSLGAYGILQRMQVEARRIRIQQLQLRFESLRNQISPHFLFNSLNTISSLIYRDTEITETFIRHLAQLYQSVMRHYDSPTIPLAEELDLVQHYGFLMQTRFEEAFSLEIDIQEDSGVWHLPPLSAQMLVENAVKHNQLSMDHPLNVRLFIEDNYLVVQNNFIGKSGQVIYGNELGEPPEHPHNEGIGIKNIENRYRFLTKKPVIIRKEDYFTVSLPLLTESNEQAYSV
jgi:sensor histidine kinase YesM